MGTRLRGATVAIAVCFVASAAPPPTPKVEQTYVLHDTLMHDDYRWMESARPDFDAWMTAQNSYTRNVLDRIPARGALLAKLRKLNEMETRSGQWSPAGDDGFSAGCVPRMGQQSFSCGTDSAIRASY